MTPRVQTRLLWDIAWMTTVVGKAFELCSVRNSGWTWVVALTMNDISLDNNQVRLHMTGSAGVGSREKQRTDLNGHIRQMRLLVRCYSATAEDIRSII